MRACKNALALWRQATSAMFALNDSLLLLRDALNKKINNKNRNNAAALWDSCGHRVPVSRLIHVTGRLSIQFCWMSQCDVDIEQSCTNIIY